MCLIKEPLCSWINLSGGLSYCPVTLFIILSLSDEKKYDITPLLHCPVLLKSPGVVNVCVHG